MSTSVNFDGILNLSTLSNTLTVSGGFDDPNITTLTFVGTITQDGPIGENDAAVAVSGTFSRLPTVGEKDTFNFQVKGGGGTVPVNVQFFDNSDAQYGSLTGSVPDVFADCTGTGNGYWKTT